ncbi:MAG: glycosyltransferase family 2 protein [Chloroflexota bacterium]
MSGNPCNEVHSKFDRSVSLLAWAYNEEELIGDFLDRAVAMLEQCVADWEIVLVNDCSTDRTLEIANARAAQEPRIRIISHKRNLNVGWACRTAIKNAQNDIVFWQTVDWSYDLSNLRIFLELTKHFDVVQGIRPTPIRLFSYIPLIRSIYRVRSRSDGLRAAVVSLANYYLLRILYGLNFHDFQNVTFYPRHLVQSLNLVGTSAFVNPEMLIKAHAGGATFLEVPIHFIPRMAGDAKGIKSAAVLRAVKDVFLNWFRWGLQLRLHRCRNNSKTIKRVAEPFFLEDELLRIVLPLFKYFRPNAEARCEWLAPADRAGK